VKSLSLGDPASCLSLEQLSTFFIFIFSIRVLGESVSYGKVAAVLVCIVGVIVQAFGDERSGNSSSSSPRSPLVADALVLVSAAASAVYMVAFKKSLPLIDREGVMIWLGLIGFLTTILYWPFFIILHVTAAEQWNVPPAGAATGWFLCGSFAALMFNFALNWGVSVASPLFFRMVTVVTVPLSFVVSLLLNHDAEDPSTASVTAMRVVGAGLICTGFATFACVVERERIGSQHRTRAAAAAAAVEARRRREQRKAGDDSASEQEMPPVF